MIFFNKKEDKLNDRVFIIAGLGNMGDKYENTRHNVGFIYDDAIIKAFDLRETGKKFDSICYEGFHMGKKILLLKPQTYMNLSGTAVVQACNYYKIPLNTNLLVVYDDINLPTGNIRIRKNGSAGGHNGIKNIISCLKGDQFTRIRLGINAAPSEMDLADYVLGHFTKEEMEIINDSVDKAVKATEEIIAGNVDRAMNSYNTPRKKQRKDNDELTN